MAMIADQPIMSELIKEQQAQLQESDRQDILTSSGDVLQYRNSFTPYQENKRLHTIPDDDENSSDYCSRGSANSLFGNQDQQQVNSNTLKQQPQIIKNNFGVFTDSTNYQSNRATSAISTKQTKNISSSRQPSDRYLEQTSQDEMTQQMLQSHVFANQDLKVQDFDLINNELTPHQHDYKSNQRNSTNGDIIQYGTNQTSQPKDDCDHDDDPIEVQLSFQDLLNDDKPLEFYYKEAHDFEHEFFTFNHQNEQDDFKDLLQQVETKALVDKYQRTKSSVIMSNSNIGDDDKENQDSSCSMLRPSQTKQTLKASSTLSNHSNRQQKMSQQQLDYIRDSHQSRQFKESRATQLPPLSPTKSHQRSRLKSSGKKQSTRNSQSGEMNGQNRPNIKSKEQVNKKLNFNQMSSDQQKLYPDDVFMIDNYKAKISELQTALYERDQQNMVAELKYVEANKKYDHLNQELQLEKMNSKHKSDSYEKDRLEQQTYIQQLELKNKAQESQIDQSNQLCESQAQNYKQALIDRGNLKTNAFHNDFLAFLALISIIVLAMAFIPVADIQL